MYDEFFLRHDGVWSGIWMADDSFALGLDGARYCCALEIYLQEVRGDVEDFFEQWFCLSLT